MTVDKPTGQLCDLIAGIQYDDLGSDTVARVKDARRRR